MSDVRRSRSIGLAVAGSGGLLFAIVAGTILGSGASVPIQDADAGLAAYPSGEHVDAGAEAAVQMVDRLQRFRTGDLGRRITFEGDELTAILRHVAPGLLPEGVSDPVVRIVGSKVLLRARVAPQALPGGDHLGGALSAIQELVDVELSGTLQLQGTDWIAYRIERAEVEGLPLPTSVVAGVVRSWPGGRVEGGPEAPRPMILARWPLRETRIRVRGDVLVLQRDEPILVESVDGGDGV